MVKSEGHEPGSDGVGEEAPVEPAVDTRPDLITLDELTHRVGLSVRTIRFYTTRGLVPPPIRRGRSGYYSPEHIARLELVQDLQNHGFTLAAIEKYVARIPEDATPEDIALRRSMLEPWQVDRPTEMTLAALRNRAGRDLDHDELRTLEALGVIEPTGRGRYAVSTSQLTVTLTLLDLGFPIEAAEAASKVYREHGRQIAEELMALFRTMVWPAYKESGASPETIRAVVEQLKPVSVASLVAAYEAAMDDARRRQVTRRTGD